MVSEETTLQSLLRNRKIVRNYKESKLEFPQLSEVAEHAIKILKLITIDTDSWTKSVQQIQKTGQYLTGLLMLEHQ